MNFLLRLYVLICTFLKNINCCSSSWWLLFCNIFISVSNSHFKNNLNDEEMSISRLMWCVNYIINKNCLRDKTITEKYLAKIVSAKNHLVIAIFRILKCLKEYKKKTELTYTFHLNWNVLFSVSSYTLSFANFPFSTIYPAIIRSSGPIEFWEKSVLYKYCKIHEKNLCWNSRVLVLNEVANLQRLTLSKNRLWRRWFLVNFWKFLRTLFL